MRSNLSLSIINSYHEGRLSHAFLIETNDQEICLKELKLILGELNCESTYESSCDKCNLCHLIDIDNLPSLMIVRPDGMNIRKEQILNIKRTFSTKPIYSKFNMYIILNAEKLNASSANSILKFLEEPEEGILGFFVTNNKENMIDTIKSRCQILSAFYQENSQNSTYQQLAIELLYDLHVNRENAIFHNRDRLEKSLSKDEYQQIFQEMISIYLYFYKRSISKQIDNCTFLELQFLDKKSPAYLLQQLKLVQNLEQELSYNVNMNLLLDRLVLETE